jgi:acyl-CoA oxidase
LAEDNFERIKRKDFSTFNETHAILSGGKSYYTYFVNETCEWTRLSCGGHGFAHYSGLPA